jgi:2-polyprenyl-3-methyl-5-hydroxy-6-metoxy-1,4-benzoquinol methylase
MPDFGCAYCQQHAHTFFDDTVEADMSPLYGRFVPLFADRAAILDAGCGSRRDALAFAKLGYSVTAFDASPALVALAERRIRNPHAAVAFRGSVMTGHTRCWWCPSKRSAG